MMRPLPHATLALVACLAACTPPPAPGPREPEERYALDREGARALRDYVEAGHELRLAREYPEDAAAGDAALLERWEQARARLRQSLEQGGVRLAPDADDAALLGAVARAVARGGRYAFDPTSGALLRIQERAPGRELVLFGRPFRYELVRYDEALVLDYNSYLARRLVPEDAISGRPTASYDPAGVVAVDLDSIRLLGERRYLPTVAALRERAALASDPANFTALARREQVPELIALTKDALRWRALAPLWAASEALPPAAQLDRFVRDYAERAELRAAAELEVANRLAPPGTPPDAGLRERVFADGALSAIVHGEPLGHAADLLALAGAALAGGDEVAGATRAARRLTAELVAACREGPPGPAADALAFARLANAAPDELRELARRALAARGTPGQPRRD